MQLQEGKSYLEYKGVEMGISSLVDNVEIIFERRAVTVYQTR